MSALQSLFDPDAIALIGASADPDKLVGRPHRYLRSHGYDGDLYFVNPNRDHIDGHPCYDSVTEVPASPDLAMVLVPAELTPGIIGECGEVDIPVAIVIASGFSEVDSDGAALEAELAEAAREAGVRIVGPNSEGVLHVPTQLAATFSSICKRDSLAAGPLAFISQSGAFGGALFQLTQDRDIGTSAWVSTGNELDIDTLDVLDHLIEDQLTETVVMYVEAIRDGRRLLRLGRRAADRGVDLVAIRVGASRRAQAATASHTGSVASDEARYASLFAQAGVTTVGGVTELLDTVSGFHHLPRDSRPEPSGGLGIISISGGAAALCADVAAANDLPLASLSAETKDTIDAVIPAYGSVKNPLDVTAAAITDPAVFGNCVDAVTSDPDVNAVLVQFGNSGRDVIESIDDILRSAREEQEIPVVTVFTGSVPRSRTRAALERSGVLVFEDPKRAIEVCARLHRSAEAKHRLIDGPAYEVLSRTRTFPTENLERASDRLREYGVDIVDSVIVEQGQDDMDEVVETAQSIGFPVVVKLSPLAVDHKTEVDGVVSHIDSEAALREAVNAMPTGPVVIQPHRQGIEALVGIDVDPDLGPMMTVGPGGIHVELFDEFAHRALPVNPSMAERMIAETPLARLLQGYRGTAGSAQKLAAFAAAVSDVYVDHDLETLEFNPVMVTDDDAMAVDILCSGPPSDDGSVPPR